MKYFYDIAAWFPKNMIIANKASWNKLDKATQDFSDEPSSDCRGKRLGII